MESKISFLDELEEALKAGKLGLVLDRLNSKRSSEIKRVDLVKCANIARRAGNHHLAIKFLYPIVRNKINKATAAEKAEYSMCLLRAGALAEARSLLDEIKDENVPERLLYKAFSYFSSWDYHLAIPLLKSYLNAPSLNEYQLTIAETNLADAYFSEGFYQESQELCDVLIKKLDPVKQKLNYGYIHQILGQVGVATKKFKLANDHFDQVEKIIGSSHARYFLYLRKWRSILSGYENPSPKSENLLTKVGDDARKLGVWEVVRDCDFYRAVIFDKPNLFWQVYFTTPYPHYRERMLKISGFSGTIPNSFDLVFNLDQGAPKRVFNVNEGFEELSDVRLKRGQLPHRLLIVLTSDLYRPFRVETLFSQLFPNELYNLKRSSYKVHDTISRLRAWFSENDLPFEIHEEDMQYSLRINAPYVLKFQLAKTSDSSIEAFVAELKKNFPERTFTIQDVLDLNSRPRSTVKWLLTKAVEEGLLIRIGQGRGIKYKSTT